MTPLNVLVILGSVRRGRMSERVATFVMSRLAATEGVRAELIDLRDLDLPIMEERLGRIEPTPAHVAGRGAKIEQADGLIIVSPEYNHGYPGVLKNALDYFYAQYKRCLLYTSPSPRDRTRSRMPASACKKKKTTKTKKKEHLAQHEVTRIRCHEYERNNVYRECGIMTRIRYKHRCILTRDVE